MDNDKQLISMIKQFSYNHILSCELSLYFLDLQRNYANYRYNRDVEIDNLKSGVYKLKKHKLSRKYKRIENYIWLCYIYLYIKHVKYERVQEEILEKTKRKIHTTIYQNLRDVIFRIYEERDLNQDNSKIDEMIAFTCLYMSCHMPNNVHIENMKTIIDEIFRNEKSEGGGRLREKFKNEDGKFCSGFVRVNSGDTDCYVFSGSWDNEKYPNKLTLNLPIMKDVIESVANKIFGRNVTWCIREANMRSYEFRYQDGKYIRLDDAFKKFSDKRKACLNKHFSCCERKILSYFEEKDAVDLEIYVTFKPCSDCELALCQFLKDKTGSKIKVVYDQEKTTFSHLKGCNLYDTEITK